MRTRSLYSVGVIITLWRVLLIVKQYRDQGIAVQDVINILQGSGSFGGTMPVKSSIRVGQEHDFLKIRNGIIILSDYSENEILPISDDENPNYVIFQKILFPIVLDKKFPWLIFFNEDVSIFKVAIPQDWIDILENANLFDLSNESVAAWWEGVLQMLQAYDDKLLKDIGNFGELLTVSFEKDRLFVDGFEKNQFYVSWISRISDSEGYDIKSIRGNLLKDIFDIRDEVQIEVKSSSLSNVEKFRFNVSRNEWETALLNIETYYFYCWVGIDIYNNKYVSGPFVIPAKNIKDLFPVDNHKLCQWTNCRLILDLNHFKVI